MSLSAEFSFGRAGNTVPYPPNRKRGRTNAGFTDLRGRPDLVEQIHEARTSPGLASILQMIAGGDLWISLGCDLGTHTRTKRTRAWHYAGGYIQFISSDIYADRDYYKSVAEHIHRMLGQQVGREDWLAILEVREVCYKPDGAEDYIDSLWVWFDAGALSPSRANAGRERLLDTLRAAIDCAPSYS